MAKKIEVQIVGDASNLSRALQTATGHTNRFGSALGTLATRGVLAAGAGIAAFGALSVKAAIDFESSFTGIRKTVEATEPQFKQLQAAIRDMAKELPTGVNELNKIGESAGQLGIHRKSLLGFIRTVADLGETTNLVGEEASSSLAKIANVTGMKQTNENFKRLGSTIVALGNQGASTEADIVAMGLRIAATGRQVGLTAPQVLGLANALSSLGIEAESGGSAVSMTFAKMQSAVGSGGAALENFAKSTGVSAAQFKKAFAEDAMGALDLLLGGLKRTIDTGGDVQGFLNKLGLGGLRTADTLKRLAQNQQLVTDSVKAGSEAWKANTALTVEAEKRYATTASQLKILHNRWTDLKITVGEKLLPILNAAIKEIVQFAETFSAAPTITAKLKVVWEGVSEVATDLWDKIVAAWEGDQRTIFVDLTGRTEVVGTEGIGDAIKRNLREQMAAIDWSDLLITVGVGLAKGVLQLQKAIWTNIMKAWLAAWGLILSTVRDQAARLPGVVAAGITQGIPAVAGAAVRLGGRIVAGIRSGLTTIVEAVAEKLAGVLTAIQRTAKNAYDWAAGIGSRIIQGIISGLAGLIGQVGSAIASKVRAGIDWAKDHVGSTAGEYAAAQLGKPMGQGVIDGWIKSTATLPEKMAKSLRMAIEYARKAIASARDRLGSAFDGVTSRILRAFDAESQGMETTHEKILREIDERRTMEDLVQRQADAQTRLNEAIATGDAAAIAAAQRDLTRATEDIAMVDIAKVAEEERKNLDSLREEQRIHLEKKLTALETSFVKEGASVKKAMAAMAKLMASFGIDFETAGALVGEAFVAGLKRSLGAAAAAAAGVDRVVPGASGFRAPAVAAAGGGGSQPIIVYTTVELDKQKVGQSVTEVQFERSRSGDTMPWSGGGFG